MVQFSTYKQMLALMKQNIRTLKDEHSHVRLFYARKLFWAYRWQRFIRNIINSRDNYICFDVNRILANKYCKYCDESALLVVAAMNGIEFINSINKPSYYTCIFYITK